MSDQEPEAIELPRSDDAAFAALMDTLAPVEEAGEGAAGGAAAGAEGGAAGAAPAAGAAEAGAAAAAGGGAGAAGGAPVPPVAGGNDAAGGTAGGSDHAAGDAAGAAGTAGGGADALGGAGDRPADWTASAADVAPELDKLATALEERTLKAYQQAALTEVQTEHSGYFEALNKHPRMLVGVEVPAIGKEGMEVLRDANDAREWQDAVKQLLVQEVKSRASQQLDENRSLLTTIHSSISLFQDNPDLIPGTKEFDIDLANRFSTMATPYELRVEGKLQGYSIPVQPLIEQIRNQLVAERSKPPAEAPAATPAKTPTKQPDPPQAGIPARAGAGGDPEEDFSTLFATIDPSLSNLQI